MEFLLRALGLLGVPLGPWEATNAPAAGRLQAAADALPAGLAPILPSWRPPGGCIDTRDARPSAPPPAEAAAPSAAEGVPPAAAEAWLSPGPVHDTPAAPQPTAAAPDAAVAAQGVPSEQGGDAGGTSPAGAGAGRTPWYAATEERRGFAAALLEALVTGPCSGADRFPDALLAVEATPVTGVPSSAVGDQEEERRQAALARAQASAQRLLAAHRDSLLLWRAYAGLLCTAGQHKVRT